VRDDRAERPARNRAGLLLSSNTAAGYSPALKQSGAEVQAAKVAAATGTPVDVISLAPRKVLTSTDPMLLE